MKAARYLPQFLWGPLVRRHAKLHATPLERFTVRVARTAQDYEDAFALLRSAYICMGYESVHSSDMRITPQHVLPEATVLVAYEGRKLVATMTVTLDSPAGLPIDLYYGSHLDELRARGARLVEYGSLAVVRRCWSSGVTQLLYMAAHQIATMLEATDLVIEVHPKAQPIYRAIFGFEPMGRPVRHGNLDMEVLGLHLDFSRAVPFIRRHFRRRMTSGMLPIEHFTDTPPRCIELPPRMDFEAFVRWKLPRQVFQELFMEKSDHLADLDDQTRDYLGTWRTLKTLGVADRSVVVALSDSHHKSWGNVVANA